MAATAGLRNRINRMAPTVGSTSYATPCVVRRGSRVVLRNTISCCRYCIVNMPPKALG